MKTEHNPSLLEKSILEAVLSKARPVRVPELYSVVDSPVAKEQEVDSAIGRLCKTGLLARLRGNRVGIAKEMDLVLGRVEVRTNGVGVLVPDEAGDQIYLSPRQMRRVMPDDRVLGRIQREDRQGRKEGAIVAVLNYANRTVLGCFESDCAVNVITAKDSRISHTIHVGPGDGLGAEHGQMVVGEIIAHPADSTYVQAKVIEVLAQDKPAALATEFAIRRHQLPTSWSPEVERELEQINPVQKGEGSLSGLDLTALPFVTIDGADARDFDDAVHCTRQGDEFRLDVAIADVSRHVIPDSALDRAARERGNSVYFPDRVVPMLPELLSNDLCSLRPGETRFVFACRIRVTPEGEVTGWEFHEAQIQSSARLTYEQASEFLCDPDDSKKDLPAAVQDNLKALEQVAKALGTHRRFQGGVEFNFPQTQVSYNGDGTIASITATTRQSAMALIEECMLAANVCAARTLDAHLPEAVFRVHESPDSDAVADLQGVLGFFGIKLKGGAHPPASAFSAALRQGRECGAPLESLQMLILRSMKQARYASGAQPHFALGFACYTHFTSPIRRYADLLVHRLIKAVLGIGRVCADSQTPGRLAEVSDHCSLTDRRAEEASREVQSWLKAEFMSRHLGQEFRGKVTGVTPFGVFVTIESMQVDGLVHISELGDDYLHFDSRHMFLVAEHSGERICLGDPMVVKVAGARPDEGKIDFIPVKSVSERPKGRRKRRPGKGRQARKAR